MIPDDLAERAFELLRQLRGVGEIQIADAKPHEELTRAYVKAEALAATLSTLPEATRKELHAVYRDELKDAEPWKGDDSLLVAVAPFFESIETLLEELRRDRLLQRAGGSTLSDPWNE